MVAVPWREIDGKAQTQLLASLRQIAHHIALSVFPRRILDRVFSIFAWPKAETAMVLHGQDDTFHARILACLGPLSCIEPAWVEQFGRLIAISPFLVGIGVERIVYESVHLHVLKPQLTLFRYRVACSRLWGRATGTESDSSKGYSRSL